MSKNKVLVNGIPVLLHPSKRLKTTIHLSNIAYQVAIVYPYRFYSRLIRNNFINKTITAECIFQMNFKNPYCESEGKIYLFGEVMNVLFFPKDHRRDYNFNRGLQELAVHYNDEKMNKYEALVWTVKKVADPIIRDRFTEIFNSDYKQLSKTPFKLKIKRLEGKWGICHKTSVSDTYTITINVLLIHYDLKYLDYIIHHEINHIIEANHSFKFWENLKGAISDYVTLKKELNDYTFYRGYNLY